MSVSNLCQAQQFAISCGQYDHRITNSHHTGNVNHITTLVNKFTASIHASKATIKLASYLFGTEAEPHKIEVCFDDGSLLRIKHQKTCEMVQRVFGIHEEIELIYLPKELVIRGAEHE